MFSLTLKFEFEASMKCFELSWGSILYPLNWSVVLGVSAKHGVYATELTVGFGCPEGIGAVFSLEVTVSE